MSVARGTVHSIQFLRFLAATSVVIFHAHIGFATELTGSSPDADYWLRFGAVGVHVFFVISGYIMYLTNIARPVPFDARRFLTRRLIRVYPVYWVFVALYLVADAAMAASPTLTPGEFAGMLALWPEDAPRVVGQAWTLSFEVYFYLVFGLVMTLGERRGTAILTAFFLLSVVAGLVLRPPFVLLSLMTNSLLLEFVAGVWIARVTTRRAVPRGFGWAALAAAVAGYAMGLFMGYDRLPSAFAWGIPSALLVAGAVILERTGTGEGQGLVRRLSRLGDSSYSLYLCHLLVVTLIVAALRALDVRPPLVLLVPVTTLACIALAELFYRAVERPMVGRLHRLTESRGARQTASA